MSKPLINPVRNPDDNELNQLIQFYEETLGFCPNSVLTMFHRPRIAFAFIEMNKAVMENKGRVSSALKRMIAFISSNVAGCRYCQAHTIRAAERYGAAEDQLKNIWDFQTHPAFSPAEKAALEFAVRCSTVPNTVDENCKKELKNHWDEGEIVEITGVIALFGYLNRWNDSMGTQIEGGAVDSAEKWLADKGWTPGKHS